jgi:hypothetical protein
MTTTPRQDRDPAYAVGTRWCAVASYHDGSGLLGIYGPYGSKGAADAQVKNLIAIGIYVNEKWETMPIRRVAPGTHDA